MTLFDKLNKDTFDYNNGITRTINPTNNIKIKATDLLANYNNYTYKQNNGQYSDKLYK